MSLFRKISDNYVDLVFSDMDFRYRDTFLTKFAGINTFLKILLSSNTRISTNF